MLKYIVGPPILVTLVERSKVNLDLGNRLLKYQVRTMALASTVLKNELFKKKSNLNSIGSEFDLHAK